MLELTDSVDKRTMTDQVLDDMDIEKERGITIKARAVTMRYQGRRRQDLRAQPHRHPGSRGLPVRSQPQPGRLRGRRVWWWTPARAWKAQTLANCYLALDHNLEVVPILNKIDLPSADPDAVAKEVEDVIGLPCMEGAAGVRPSLGIGVKDVLECVVKDIPAPSRRRGQTAEGADL